MGWRDQAGAMIIYLNLDADHQEIVRALRRELGSEMCRRVGLALAEERFVVVLDAQPDHEAEDGDRP